MTSIPTPRERHCGDHGKPVTIQLVLPSTFHSTAAPTSPFMLDCSLPNKPLRLAPIPPHLPLNRLPPISMIQAAPDVPRVRQRLLPLSRSARPPPRRVLQGPQ